MILMFLFLSLLESYSEVVGLLKKVNEKNNTILLTFDEEIEIPQNAIFMDKLKNFVGNICGLFNAGGGIYRIRRISPCFKKEIRKNKNWRC